MKFSRDAERKKKKVLSDRQEAKWYIQQVSTHILEKLLAQHDISFHRFITYDSSSALVRYCHQSCLVGRRYCQVWDDPCLVVDNLQARTSNYSESISQLERFWCHLSLENEWFWTHFPLLLIRSNLRFFCSFEGSWLAVYVLKFTFPREV